MKQNICKKGIRVESQKHIEGRNKKQSKKPRSYSTSSSEVDENVLCDDDDDDCDGEFYDEGQSGINELCVICTEFGKNGELWYRCVSCGKWPRMIIYVNDV